MNWEQLINYVNGTCNPSEEAQVRRWRNKQKEHQYLLAFLESRRAQLNKPLKQADIDEQWIKLLNRIFNTPASTGKPGYLNSYWITGIAATLLVVSLLGSFWYRSIKNSINAAQVQTVATTNMRELLTLPDGSHVYMAPGSKLSYRTNFGKTAREVALTGEAFFDVKHDSHKPFIVRTVNNQTVTVLGTSFNVYSRLQLNTEIKVATGLVGVTGTKGTKYLKAGQQLICLANGSSTVSSVSVPEAEALQRQTLVFNDDDAAAIAVKIERWYNIKVEVLPAAAKRPRFSGEMKDTGIDNLLNGLHYATGMHYRHKDPHTILLF